MSQPHHVNPTCETLRTMPRKAVGPPDEATREFGRRLRIELDRLGIKVTALAAVAKIDQGNLSGFMGGTRGLSAATLVHALEAAGKAGCDMRFIVTGARSGVEVGLSGLSADDVRDVLEMVREHRAAKAPADVLPGPSKKRRKA